MSTYHRTTAKFLFPALLAISIAASADHVTPIDAMVECGEKVQWGKDCGIAVKCSGDAMGSLQVTYPDPDWGTAAIAWLFEDDPDGVQWIPNAEDPGCLGWQPGDDFPTRAGPTYEDQIPGPGEPGYEEEWELCTYLPVNDNAQIMCFSGETFIHLPANPAFTAKCEGQGSGHMQSVGRIVVDFSGCGFEWIPNSDDPGCLGWVPGAFYPTRTGTSFVHQIPAPGEPGYVAGWEACSYIYY